MPYPLYDCPRSPGPRPRSAHRASDQVIVSERHQTLLRSSEDAFTARRSCSGSASPTRGGASSSLRQEGERGELGRSEAKTFRPDEQSVRSFAVAIRSTTDPAFGMSHVGTVGALCQRQGKLQSTLARWGPGSRRRNPSRWVDLELPAPSRVRFHESRSQSDSASRMVWATIPKVPLTAEIADHGSDLETEWRLPSRAPQLRTIASLGSHPESADSAASATVRPSLQQSRLSAPSYPPRQGGDGHPRVLPPSPESGLPMWSSLSTQHQGPPDRLQSGPQSSREAEPPGRRFPPKFPLGRKSRSLCRCHKPRPKGRGSRWQLRTNDRHCRQTFRRNPPSTLLHSPMHGVQSCLRGGRGSPQIARCESPIFPELWVGCSFRL